MNASLRTSQARVGQFQLARILSTLETAFSLGIKVDSSNAHAIVFCGRVLEFLDTGADGQRRRTGAGAAPVDDASAVEPVEPRGRAQTDAAAQAAASNANAVLRPPGTVPALRDNVALRGWICTAFRTKQLIIKLNAAVEVPERIAEFYYPYSLLSIARDYNQLCEHLELLQELPCVVDPGVRLRSASLTADPDVLPAASQSPQRSNASTPTGGNSRSRSGSGSGSGSTGSTAGVGPMVASNNAIPWNHVIYARNNVEVSASSGALDEAVEEGRASLGYLQVFSRDDAWDIKLESQDSLLRISDLKLTWTSNENLVRSATAAAARGDAEGGGGGGGGGGEVESPQPRPLPGGWDSGYDPTTGETYYIDHATCTTTWDYPAHLVTALALAAAEAALASGNVGGDNSVGDAADGDGGNSGGSSDGGSGDDSGASVGGNGAGRGGEGGAGGNMPGGTETAVGFNVNGADVVGPWTSDSTEIDLLAVAPSLVAVWRNPINPDAGCIAISCGLPGVQPGCVIFMLKRGVRFLSAALRRCAGCRLVIVPSRDIHGQVIIPEPISTSVWDKGFDGGGTSGAGAGAGAGGAVGSGSGSGGESTFANVMPGEPLTPTPPLTSAPWSESPARPASASFNAADGADGADGAAGGAAVPSSSVTAADLISFETWFAGLNDDGQVIDFAMFKRLVFFRGLQPEIRTMIWPYLLGVYSPDLTFAGKQQRQRELVAEYDAVKLEWQCVPTAASEAIRFQLKNISKDVVRTDRDHPLFSGEGNPILKVMMDIIMTYSHVHPSIEYYQGMTDLLASLLIVTMDEALTYHCFCSQMNHGGGADFGKSDQAMNQELADIGAITKVFHPEFYAYLETCYLSGMLFCYRWVVLDFRREFARPEIFHLWETLWCQQRCQNFNLLVAVAILDLYAPTSAEYSDVNFNSLEYFSNLALTMDFQAVLRKARELVYTFNMPDHGLPEDTWRRVMGNDLPGEDRRSSIEVAGDDGRSSGGSGDGGAAGAGAGAGVVAAAGQRGGADADHAVEATAHTHESACADAAAVQDGDCAAVAAAAAAAVDVAGLRGSVDSGSSAGGSDMATAAVRAAAASPDRSSRPVSFTVKYSGNHVPEMGSLEDASVDIAAEVAAAIALDSNGNHVAALAAYMQAIDSLLNKIRTGVKMKGGKALKRCAKNLLLRAEYLKGSL